VEHPARVLRQSPVIRVQHLARRVAETYALEVGTIVVAFRSDLWEAGHVELGGSHQRDSSSSYARSARRRRGLSRPFSAMSSLTSSCTGITCIRR
jgi:hypothetical protein